MQPLTDAQKATIKRLAEAMLAGAKKRPQAVEVLFRRADGLDGNPNGEICSCALGAAWEGSHPDFDAETWHETRLKKPLNEVIGLEKVWEYFDHFEQINVLDPMGTGGDSLDSIIVDLNDRHGWTREKIANWLLELVS